VYTDHVLEVYKVDISVLRTLPNSFVLKQYQFLFLTKLLDLVVIQDVTHFYVFRETIYIHVSPNLHLSKLDLRAIQLMLFQHGNLQTFGPGNWYCV